MPFLKGIAPVRNTIWYLNQGIVELHPSVRIVAFACASTRSPTTTTLEKQTGLRHQAMREFLFWHFGQLQYKNPTVQLLRLYHISPFPYIHVFLDSGEEVLIDVDNKSRTEILERIRTTIGKPKSMLDREASEKIATSVGAEDFGEEARRQCMCEVQGQWPCPRILPVPKYLKGRWRWNKNTL